MPGIGPMEIVVVLAIMLIIFGPKKLPELGRGIGGGMREFKQSVTGTLPALAEQPESSEPAVTATAVEVSER
ncbi:MAG: twin-arginine translocase TatA/TatE family subunit [Actinobacteria bacterium]|nr:twin-arginine translocase TatA/TatE family subunit [Actinomycetota bacterium]